MKNRKNFVITAFVLLFCVLVCIGYFTYKAREESYAGEHRIEVIGSMRGGGLAIPDQKSIEKRASSVDKNIYFTGRVVDHRGEPVSGAAVAYSVTDGVSVWRRHPGSLESTFTDEKGKFEIGPHKAWSVRVRSVSKSGYRFLQKGLEYSIADLSLDAHSTLEFVLVPSQFDFYSVVRFNDLRLNLNWNGKDTEVPLGKSGHTAVFQPIRNKKEGESWGFDWEIDIKIKDGQILLVPEGRVVLLAPLEGYQNAISIGYKREDPRWSRVFQQRRFIFKTNDGKYGRFDLSIHADQKDGSYCGGLSGTFNPNAERFLD